MNALEVAKLVRLIRAIQPAQKVDEYTIDAWTPLLEDVTASDAFPAVKELGKRQSFISPADIIAEVRRMRTDRIGKIDPLEPPDADPDDPIAYIQALRRRNAEIAAHPDRVVHRPALPSSPVQREEQRDINKRGVQSIKEILKAKRLERLAKEAEKRKPTQGEP